MGFQIFFLIFSEIYFFVSKNNDISFTRPNKVVDSFRNLILQLIFNCCCSDEYEVLF